MRFIAGGLRKEEDLFLKNEEGHIRDELKDYQVELCSLPEIG